MHYDLGSALIGYTGSMTAPPGSPSPLARAEALGIDARARRQVALFGGALALGLLVVPLLIWIIGDRTLGPYTRGDDPRGLGPLALYGDFFSGLAHGWLGYWAVALGPALLLLAFRLWRGLLRWIPRD